MPVIQPTNPPWIHNTLDPKPEEGFTVQYHHPVLSYPEEKYVSMQLFTTPEH